MAVANRPEDSPEPTIINLSKQYWRHSHLTEREAFETTKSEKRLLAFLSFYKMLCEGNMPVLFAPIIASMVITTGPKTAKAYRIDQEGKAKLSQLQQIQYEWSSQKKQLVQGLNSHLRNSYSHECYRFLDGNRNVFLVYLAP